MVKAFEGIPEELVNMSSFWEHSVAVGIIGPRRKCPHSQGDSFYIPGLLHDIGRLVGIAQAARRDQRAAARTRGHACTIFQLERNLLGFRIPRSVRAC